MLISLTLGALLLGAEPLRFEKHLIDHFPAGYQVAVADLNGDGRPDVIALSTDADRVDWYENPGWQRHPIARTAKNIDLAVRDLDGTGRPAIALASGFYFNQSNRGGEIQLLRQPAKADDLWRPEPIAVDPVVHRLRWADLEGTGRPVLVHAPIFGPGSQGTQAPKPAHLWAFRPPRQSGRPWEIWKIDESLTVLHGICIADLDGDGRDEILTASFEGIHCFDFKGQGQAARWRKVQLARGAPPADDKPGAARGTSEVAVLRLAKGRLMLAAIEPWHGNQVVVYSPPEGDGLWHRQVIDDTLQEGHALVTADFDGDGQDEIVAGWRAGGGGLRLYKALDATGRKFTSIDLDPDMPAEGAVVADINGDGKPDLVVIGGRKNQLAWYENRTPAPAEPSKPAILWIAAEQAVKRSPLMASGSELHLCEDGALGDFLVPTVAANPAQPGDASFAEFHLDIPQGGTYYLWARLRYPSGRAESFAVSASTAKSGGAAPVLGTSAETSVAFRSAKERGFRGAKGDNPKDIDRLVLGGSGVGVRQWHWDSHGDGATCTPGAGRLRLELPAGACTLRIQAHEAGASVFYPLRWRQAEPAFTPRLNTLCLTSDPHYVPDDKAAGRALAVKPGVSAIPHVQAVSLPAISDAQWQAAGKSRLPDWMRCPRWYTKDAWYEEIAGRQPGDIAALVRQVAANGGSALRLSVYYGGYAFYQSRLAPHVPGLGGLDYLREAIDEGRSTGVKIVVYMNPNCLREGHPLFDACSVRDADGRAVPCGPAYGSNAASSRYSCINHPRYRQFLRDVLTEIFTRYRPAGLYVDGLSPHVCCCEHCRAKYREMFGVEMPAAKLSRVALPGVTWGEYGGDPEAVGDVENDLDCRRLTQMLYRSLVEVTHEFTETVKGCQAEAVTAYHSHPKPACAADYDATLTEVYSSRPWVHTAWRCGELAGFSNVFHVPVLFNVYPHEHFTAAEARYKAIQGLAAGAYPNFWSTPGMQPVFDFMRRNAEYLDFATTTPVKFLALARDVRLDPTQAATPTADGVRYHDDRFLAPAVGAYAALTRSALPVVTLHRPHFHEHLSEFQVLCLANMTNMSDAQVEAVRRYVRSGGGLIASHETSLYDEKGRRRPDFGLADVFGARYRRVLGTASRRVRFEPAQPLAAGLAGLPPLEQTEPHVAVDLTTGRSAARLTGPDLAPDVPAAIVHEFGKGRVVYLPGRLDALECYQLTPQVERLFANAVRWLMRGRLPIEVTSPGMVGVSYFRQPRRLLVHLVNHQRDSRFRDDAFQPLERVGVRLQLPPGFAVARVHRLWTPSEVAYQCNGDCLMAELDSIGEYEVLAVELKPSLPPARCADRAERDNDP